MKGVYRSVLACLALIMLASVLMVGCNFFSPERNRRRYYTMRTDLERMGEDVDWILGFDRPSRLYDHRRPQ